MSHNGVGGNFSFLDFSSTVFAGDFPLSPSAEIEGITLFSIFLRIMASGSQRGLRVKGPISGFLP